jgi:lysophospholipase L1-like esterase
MRAITFLIAVSIVTVAYADPLRIMPLGDSITAGNDNFSLTPGGYRTTLYGLLDAAGYDFDFVGSLQTNPGPIPDNDHEGHGGYTLLQLHQIIAAPIVATQPDVILLLAGTGDVSVSLKVDPTLTAEGIAGRLDTLLSDLYYYRPNATVFVGTIPAADTSVDGLAHSALSAEVNALFPDVLAAHAALGRSVHLVDLRALLTPADLADSLHPNPAGYAIIGQAWFDAIEAVLPLPGDVNGDGLVNIFDVNMISAHWNEVGPDGDANRDGIVNVFDINYVSSHWTPVMPVPEPSGIILGLVGLALACRVINRLETGCARIANLQASMTHEVWQAVI